MDTIEFISAWLSEVDFVLGLTCCPSTKDNFLDNAIRKSYNDVNVYDLSLTRNRHNLTDGILLKILVVTAILAITPLLSQEAFADTSLTLYKIPSSVYEGQTVTFTGTLYADGRPLANKIVYIQEDDFGPDEVLVSGQTDQNGRFSINWRVYTATFETEFEIYAIFEGDSSHNKDRTRNQYMDVYELRGTTVTLYKIPKYVYAGDTVTFTGTLQHGGQPLAGKRVYIQDEDEFRLDDYLKSGITDQNGRFSIKWIAKVDSYEDELEIRAVFEGDSSFGQDTSYIQEMIVTKIGGDITLNRFPSTAKVGQAVTFSGTLSLDRGNPQGAVVYIKDEDSFSRDELLVTAYVESNGRFSATWIAEHTDVDNTIDIFAVFEGDSRHYRQATCSATCGDTASLHISGRVNPSPPTTPPTIIQPPPNSGPIVPDGSRYMEMKYVLDLNKPPHVAIVPDPDAYNQVSSHIVPIQEGINIWTHELERAYSSGNWGVTFELVPPGDRFNSRPDVIVNLITHERDDRCLGDIRGWAPRLPNLNNPIQTHVCSTFQGEKRPNQDVMRTAGHEFIHAMGLGHAFNKPGDVMCSRENNIPTCRPEITKSSTPSSLNLGAVAKIYGTDGFQNPNNFIKYESRYAEGGSVRTQPNVQPPSTPPQTRTQYPNGCTTDDRRYNISLTDRELKPGWYRWYTICNTGTVQYSFSAADRDAGFALYVLPPAADARDYVKNGKGYPHPCEDTTKHWFSKSNTCYLRVGSSIVLHNDRDVSITINGRITTDVVRQTFPNNCTVDNARYDFTANDFTLKSGWYKPYTICNTGPVQYSFSTTNRDAGFKLYVLPPETDVRGYVNDSEGYYITCEDPDKRWFSKPGTCNVSVGSRIVLYNDSTVPITINGWIRT